jgi:hypothetical protein
MSCVECAKSQKAGHIYPIRIENGNLMVSGCREHVSILFNAFNEALE